MPFRTRTWFIISLLCFVLAGVFWQLARRKEAQRDLDMAERAATNAPAVPAISASATTNAVPATAPAPHVAPAVAKTNAASLIASNDFPHRLSNSAKDLDELLRSDQGILLGNALLDTAAPLQLPIPAQLRAEGDPGSYVVQSRGPLTDAFRDALRRAGAEIVSYVPNNAYLVRASTAAIAQLGALPETQAVLPWEPYFKLEPSLLALAVEGKFLPENSRLNLLLFPGEQVAVKALLEQMGAVINGEERSPFGPQLIASVPVDSLPAIARLAGIHVIEYRAERKPASDLARARVKVSANTVTNGNYRGLTGSGVLVNVNDTGIDQSHPAFATDRVTSPDPSLLVDVSGHGTHVAGILAGDGAGGPAGTNNTPRGSVTNASYRGMAHQAKLMALGIDPIFNVFQSDSYLQQTAARSNAFISNNSWTYPGQESYSLAAANWDAAARDALPGDTGPQPLTLVFAAGNVDPAFGFGGRISAPATAKNVITVGAIENYRLITNFVTTVIDGGTNRSQAFLSITDSSNQVAGFSARGNVGIGQEGPSGRFKPDVVAPGTFVVSTRSAQYVDPSGLETFSLDEYPDEIIPARSTNLYRILIPPEGQRLVVVVAKNASSPTNLPAFFLQARGGTPPTPADLSMQSALNVLITNTPGGGLWYYSVGNTNNFAVPCQVRAVAILTNYFGDYFDVLKKLNDPLKPGYRFETGTSQAAPVVSGMLALLQQHFAGPAFNRTNSPALMKALLINGARSLGAPYDYRVTNSFNQQGWGLPNLTNCLPINGLVDGAIGSSGSLIFFEQSTNRALVTGASFTRIINLTAAAQNFPLRFTLVWTDPPGNPAVMVKLVNDLDLIVTNLVTGAVYAGNNFPLGSQFAAPYPSNSTFTADYVNNVENVFLSPNLSTSYSVTVRARRVNVNAVTTQSNGVAQDFALIIATDRPTINGALTPVTVANGFNPNPVAQVLTNGLPNPKQRCGANAPFLITTNGNLQQWAFYSVTNRLPPSDPCFSNNVPSTNLAIVVFQPLNLSIARQYESDLDLFVTTNAAITNLNPAAIAGARRNVGRSGSASIIFGGDAVPDEIYYIGVKCEDQQAGEFTIFAVSSCEPFGSVDGDGNIVQPAFVVPAPIPDADDERPGGVDVFAFVSVDVRVRNVVVTNAVTHENIPDLLGVLSHVSPEGVPKFSVLNANQNNPTNGFTQWVFDDSDSGNVPGSIPTDRPGTLRNFAGERSEGAWRMTMIDNSSFFTGRVDRFIICIKPELEGTNFSTGFGRLDGLVACETVQPLRWSRHTLDVPNDATNLFVCVAPQNGPVEVYVRRGQDPTETDYDFRQVVLPPGDCLFLTRRDAPPLSAGIYYISFRNPNPTTLDICYRFGVERDPSRGGTLAFRSQEAVNLLDDAVTNSSIFVNDNRLVADARVGVRIDHPRVADLVLHLVSPSGTRILLSENRGNLSGDGYGFGTQQSNSIVVPAIGFSTPITNVISGSSYEGTLQVTYDFFNAPDRMTIYYDGERIFDSGTINGGGTFSIDYGPGASTNLVIIVNEVPQPFVTQWTFSAVLLSGYNYFRFTDDTNFTTTPVKFALPPFTNFNYVVTNSTTNGIIVDDGFEFGFSGIVPAGNNFSGWQVDSGDVEFVGLLGPPWGLPPDTGAQFLKLHGSQPGALSTNFVTVPGFRYEVSFAYAPNVANPSPASADVLIDGAVAFSVTAPFTTNGSVWSQTNFSFYAASTNTALQFASSMATNADPLINSAGMFLDSVLVQEVVEQVTRGIYYQPEEPLTPLKGEPAFGDWKLEILDNRMGGAVTNGALLAWRLNIAFVNTNPPVTTLLHGVTNCLTLASNETAYFVVNVPFSALSASNYITASAGVDLIYDGFGVPEITEPPSTFFLTNVKTGLTVISTNGWNSFDAITNGMLSGGANRPVIRPGRRYYLAVRNRVLTTNDFCITVWFDRLDPDLTTIIPLTNVCTVGAVTSTNEYDYYSVDIAPNALQVQVTLDSFPIDLDLYLTTGLPLPLNTYFFRASTNVGLVPELIDVVDYCDMVPSNRWYIAVRNPSRVAGSNYNLCVYQTLGTVRDLRNGGTVSNQVAGSGIDYYRVNILSNTCLASFALSSGSTNLRLYAAPMELLPVNMMPTNTMFVSTNSSSSNQFIQLTSGTLTQGCWIVAVANPDAFPVPYLLTVTQQSNCDDNFQRLTNDVAWCTNAVPGQVDYYKFQASPDALQVGFETFSTNGDVDLYITRTNATPFPGPTNFLFASTNLGFTNEFICVARTPSNSVAGVWYLAVTNKSTTNVSYCIRAVELRQRSVTVLTSGVARCTNNLPPSTNGVWNSGVHFYSLAVTGKTFEAIIELYSLTGNADLYVQHGLCVTNFTTFDVTNSWSYFGYASTSLSTNREYLCVATNSMPVPLTNGLWYIAVVNRETNATNYAYCLKATLHNTNLMAHFASAGSVLCTNVGPTNLSVLDGVSYHVLHVSNNVLAVNFETISMSGDVDIYVQRTPCLVNFASLAEPPPNYPYASTNAGLVNEWICVASNSAPVPLEPGDWFIAVVNRSSPTTNVNYCLRATPVTTSQITNIVGTTNELFEGKDICRTLGSTNDTNTALGVHYYVIDVPTNGALLELETLNASGNVDLFLQYGSPCFPLFSFNAVVSNYLYSSTSLGTNNEIICVTTNTRPFPLTNGLWYAAVVNRTTASVDYCLRTRLLLTNELYHLSNGLARCSSMTKTGSDPRGEVNYYVFRVSSNAVQATFETFGANGDVDLYVQYGPCLTNYPTFRGAVTNYPYLSTNIFTNTSLHFYPYASTNRGRTNETICLVTNSLQVPLQAGDWYIAVVNRSTNNSPPVDYCVRAIEILDTQITTLLHNQPRYTNGLVPLDTNVANIGVDYYHYRVTNSAIQLSVELFIDTSNNRNVDLYVKKDLCWINPTNFTYASTHPTNHSEHVFVATNSMPVRLTQGDWYFAVVNRDPIFSADYTIRTLEFLDRDILPLANCVITPTNVVGTNLSYVFQGRDFFVFEVSTNAVQVLFEVVTNEMPVKFYLSRELPLPLIETNDYLSDNLAAGSHAIYVISNSIPVGLAPGLWFMTVENHGTGTNIAVRASEIGTTNIVRLADASSFTDVVAGLSAGAFAKPAINYHVFRVSSNAVQANFRLYGMSGLGSPNADLFISRHPSLLPTATNFHYFSTNLGLNDESIILITNGLASPLVPGNLLPGDWYVAVVNREKFPVTYTVCVAEYAVGPSPATDLVRLTNGLIYATNLLASSPFDCTSNHHYLYTVSTNPVQLDIELLGPTGNVDLYVRRFLPLPTDTAFEAASATTGANAELIRLTAGTTPPLAPGTYFITVVNHDVAAVDYGIRVVEYSLSNLGSGTKVGAILNNGDCVQSAFLSTNDPANPFIHYYKYTVTTNALRVQFELGGLTNDFNLIVSHGLPLPTFTNYSAFSTNMANCDELITFISGVTNARGATFETGDWYIGVVNTNSPTGSYRLCVREFTNAGTNTAVTSLNIYSNQLCLTISPTLFGADYYIVGKPNLSVSNWSALTSTIRATNNFIEWCTTFPSFYNFFDVRQGLAPKTQTTNFNFTLVSATNGFTLCWNAAPGLQFGVDWSDTLTSGSWMSVPMTVTSMNGTYKFTDDGSMTAALGPFRFYRIILLP